MELALDFIRTFPCGKAEYCYFIILRPGKNENLPKEIV